jgi:hypothetical protein
MSQQSEFGAITFETELRACLDYSPNLPSQKFGFDQVPGHMLRLKPIIWRADTSPVFQFNLTPTFGEMRASEGCNSIMARP